MPIIPRTNETVRMQASSPVQIASTSDARISGNAMAELGGAIQDFSAKQLEIDRNLRRAEYRDAIENEVKIAEDTARRSAAPDGSDYGQKFNEAAKPAIDKAMNQYAGNDPRLRREFESYTKRVQGNINTDIAIRSAQMMESHNFSRAEGLMNNSISRLRENTPLTPESAANYIASEAKAYGAVIDGMGMSPENAAKARKAYYEGASVAFIDGLGNKQRYGEALRYLQATQKSPDLVTEMSPEKARELGLIDSREAQALAASGMQHTIPIMSDAKGKQIPQEIANLMNGLPANKKAALIDQMRAKAQEQVQIRLSDLNSTYRGFEKIALEGGSYSEAEKQSLLRDVNAAPGLTLTARKRLIDRINSVDAVNSQLKVAKTTPRSQWGDLLGKAAEGISSAGDRAAKADPRMAGADRDFAIRESRQEALASFQSSLSAIQKQQNDDPAGFLLRNDPEIDLLARGVKDGEGVEKFATTMLNKQAYLGMPQRVLSKQQAYGIAQQLLSNPDAETKNDYLNGLQSQYGKHYPRMIQEVAKEDKALEPLAAVTYANPFTRAKALDAITAAPQLKIEFAKPENQVKRERIDMESQNVMSAFRTSVLGGTNSASKLGVVQSIEDMIKLQAQRDVLRSDISPKEAVKKAYADIVDSTYAIVSGGNQSVLVPRASVPEPRIVESFLKVYTPMKGASFEKIDYVADPQNPGRTLEVKKGSGATYNKDLIEDFQIAGDNPQLRNMRWVTNEAQTGMKLMTVLPDGTLQPVYNKQKSRVEVSYDDINLRPNKKVIEANKNIFQKLFGG